MLQLYLPYIEFVRPSGVFGWIELMLPMMAAHAPHKKVAKRHSLAGYPGSDYSVN